MPPDNLGAKEAAMLPRLANFFSEFKDVEIVKELLMFSNRIIDNFVSHVAKKKRITVGEKDTDIFLQYKVHLRTYGKKHFDIFNRNKNKLTIQIHGDDFTSTIAQLNYFRWLLSSGIGQYIVENKEFVSLMVKKHAKKYG